MALPERRRSRDNQIPAEVSRRNRESFVQWFSDRSRVPVEVQNHIYTLTYGSDPREIDKRYIALDEYLIDPPPLNEHSWARTILSELVFEDMMQRELGPILQAHEIIISPAPTALDASKGDSPPPIHRDGTPMVLSEADIKTFELGRPPYDQKGVDLVLLNCDQEALIGFDTTLGGRSTVHTKRRKPPLQPFPAMPVAVLSLQNMPMGPYKTFAAFLDRVVRPNILSHGTLHLDEWRWDTETLNFVRNNTLSSIHATRNGLHKGLGWEFEYPYLQEVFTKLDEAEQLFSECLQ